MEALEVLRTSKLPAREQLDCWNEWTSSNWSGISVSSRSHDFPAELNRLRVGSVKFARVKSVESVVLRRPHQSDSNRLILHYQQAGTTHNQQGGRATDLASGEMTLLRLDDPYTLKVLSGHRLLVAEFDERDLLERIGGVSIAGAVRFGRNNMAVSLIGSFIATLCNGQSTPDDPLSEALMENAFLDLIALSVKGNGDSLVGAEGRSLFRDAVRIIEERSSDPEFSTNEIGAALSVSARAIQMAFANCGTTPSAFLMRRRLERAASLLSKAQGNITEIAFSTGFESSSYFARCFRARYGVSPREFAKSRSALRSSAH